MKKIFIVLAAAAMAVSCGSGKDLYFAEVENRVYNDSNAEFDSLSYAFGLNFALTLESNLADLKYNREYFIEKMEKYLTSDFDKLPNIDFVSNEMDRFQKERYFPYMRAVRTNMMPNAAEKLEVPALYNEECDSLMVTDWFASMASYSLRATAIPVNIHYLVQGINDARVILGDAAGSSQPHAIDSAALAKIRPMMGYLQRYHMNELPKYNLERGKEWLSHVAKQPNVKALAVGKDTIYYRINVPGGEKMSAPTDSISLEYEVYSYKGTLVQSTDSRFDQLKKRIVDIKNDKNISDSVRRVRIKETEELIEKARVPMITGRQIFIEAIKQCLPEIGEFGSITIWTPAKFGPNNMMGQSSKLLPNEPSVINLKVRRIAKGVDVAAPMPKKPISGAGQQPGMIVKPQPTQPGTGIKVVPAPKGEKPAPTSAPQQIKVVKK